MAVIVRGGPDVFATMAFGTTHPSTMQFIQQQAQQLSETMSAAGQAFVDRGRELFERYHGHEAMRLAKAAMRAAQHLFQQDIIQPLMSISALQQAQPVMQRWIMACPEVRNMYNMQRCDGYSDTYIDMNPGTAGKDHYDYRKVTDGLLIEGGEDDDYDWRRVTTVTDINEDDVTLTISEKSDILTMWDLISTMMKSGKEDPTSPYCTTL